MAGFSVDILAKLNLNNIKTQIDSLNGTPIKFDVSGLHNDIQRELDRGNFSIRIDNINLQNMTQQMNRVGTQAGQELGRAINSTLGNITSRNSAHTMRGLEQALAGFKFDRAQIDQITRGFDEMNIAVTRVRQNIHQQGRFRLNVEGVDEFGNIVTIVKELNNQTGELTTISKHINQSFTEITNGGTSAFSGISKIIDDIGSKSGQILKLDPQKDTAEIATLENQLADLRNEYLMTMEAFGQNLNANQLRQIDAKWRKQDRNLSQISAQNIDAAAIAEQNAQLRQQADTMRQLVKVRQQMDNLDVNIARLELAGGHDNQLAELRVTKSQLESEYNGLFSGIDLGTADDSQILKLAESCEKAETKIRELTAASKDKIALNIGNQIDGFEKKVDGVKSSFSSLSGSTNLFTGVDEGIKKLKEFQDIMKNNPVDSDAYKGASSGYESLFKNVNSELEKAKTNAKEVQKAMQAISFGDVKANTAIALSESKKYKKADPNSISTIVKDLETLKRVQGTLTETANIDTILADFPEYEAALKRVNNHFKTLKTTSKGAISDFQLDSASNDMAIWLEKNSKAVKKYGKEIDDLQEELRELRKSMNEPWAQSKLDEVMDKFTDTKKRAFLSGDTGKTWLDSLGGAFESISRYVSVAEMIDVAVEAVRDMYQNVVEIDTAMTELKKVTDETDASYEKFLDNAGSKAVQLGTTVTGLINSTAGFARLGFSIEESADLAEVANIYAVVGDEINGVEDATASIVSTMTAFNVNTEDAISIVDKFNKIGNEYQISSGGIGEALQRSASSMAAANNTLDESIALIAAAKSYWLGSIEIYFQRTHLIALIA